MTIKMRLISMMAVAIIGFSTVFLTATFSLEKLSDHISEVGEHRMPHLLIVEDVISESLAFQRDILRLILIDDPARKERIQKRILNTRTHIAQLSEELAHALQSAEAKQLLSEINALRQEPVKFNNQIMELIANHQTSQAIEIATGITYRDSYEAYISKMRDMVAFEKELARKEIEQGESDTLRAKVWILSISAVVLIALILFSIFVIRSVSNAVQQLVAGVSRVTQTATFDTRLSPRDDELNEVISNLNHLFSSLETAIKASNHVVSAIAKADFTQRMQGNYVGDLAQLQQGINASAESVAFMMHELELVMNSLNAGKFDTRMDTKVPQAFRNLVEQALTNIHAVISDINQVMSKLNQGDFNARVQSQAQGDLHSMKNNINDSMIRLSDAVSGITAIVTAQSQGDLSKQLQLDLKGQLQTLKEAINHSSQQLKNIVSQAVNASNVVDSAAGQVSHSASNLSYRIQEQAAAIEETSATMTEMASAVQANTTNARQVADLTSQVKKQASDGVLVMQETIVAMQSIQESSNKIADIVNMIDAIAFQTNLLALNAAVEAARAGEHGRGFAVVAGEVRALAQKSADAARDIKHLIDDSVTRVGNGTLLAQKSGQVLNSIADSIQNVAGMVDAIAHASHEQSDGIEQVHKSISDIDRVTQENSTLVEQTNTASSRLEDEANKLRHSMAFFKT